MSTTTMPPTGSKGSLQLELFQPELSIGAASKKSAPTTSSLSCRPNFFAGIAGWPLVLRLAGWPDDRPVWTASLPCQPFSLAESREGSTTPATYGPCSKVSSSSDVLQSCLANSLRMRLNGSEMCETTWKKWNTPWGPCLLKPRARVRTTSAIDFTLWPTATTSNGGSNSASAAVCLRGHGTNLIGAVTLALWGTPRVTTNGGWGTPGAPDKSRLENQVLAGSSGS